MKPADYDLPFYNKCLSQHVWDWRERFTTTAVLRHHEVNDDMLRYVAHERGGEFLEAFNKYCPQPILPFAGVPAPEPKETKPEYTPTPPMKIEINIPDELFHPIVMAIDRLTEAVKESNKNQATVSVGTCSAPMIDGVPPPAVKRTRKSKDAEPVVETPPPAEPVAETQAPVVEPTPSTPEPEPVVETPPAAPCPTGPQLAAKVGPLASNPALQQELIAFKKEVLGIFQPIKEVTDENLLRQFEAKANELLAKMNEV